MGYAASWQLIPISLVVIALLPGVPTGAAGGAGSPAPLSKGWGRFLASGIVARVDPRALTMTLAIAGQGRLDTLEGQDRWRSQPATGTQVVHLVPATVISDAGDDPATIAAIRIGAPAMVWGAVTPDSSVFGLKVVMAPPSTRSFTARSTGTPYALSGTVLGRSGGMIELLTPQGVHRSVIVTGATTVQNAAGSTVPLSAIDRYDVVRVEGTVNSDGSVAAIRIDVDLDAADAAQVSGAVDQVFGEVEGLVVAGVMVPIPPGCYFIKGAGPGAFRLLAPGQAVTVYGISISVGSTPIGLRARVVVAR